MGNIACCKDENCGRGRALYATGPPMKDCFYFFLIFLIFNFSFQVQWSKFSFLSKTRKWEEEDDSVPTWKTEEPRRVP